MRTLSAGSSTEKCQTPSRTSVLNKSSQMTRLQTKEQTHHPIKLTDVTLDTKTRSRPSGNQSDSDSSSSSTQPTSKNRQKNLAARSRHRWKKYVDEAMEAADQGLSLLEKKAIGKEADKYYNTEYSLFQAFALKNALSLNTPSSVDTALTKYMNHLFLQGHPSHRGDKLLASYMHRHPEFNRFGSSRLPHSYRALKGWRKLAPGSSRKAFPLAVWAAISVEMVRQNCLRMALFTMTCVSAYTPFQVQDGFLDSSNFSSHRTLEPFVESGRVEAPFEDGRIRRQHLVRLSLFEALGLDAVQGTSQATSSTVAMGLQLSELLRGVHGSSEDTPVGCDTVQHETFGAIHRSKSKPSTIAGSSKEGKVEKSQKCGPIRKVCTSCCKLQPNPAAHPTSLPARRITSRGCDAGPYQAPSASLKRGNRPNTYVADFFAGKGGVAHQCRRLGYKAKEWELERGSQFDLTSRVVRKRIIADILKGRVLAAMFAPPCTTFSVARDRTKVIRSREYPWGLPAPMLTPSEQEKVLEGNRCFEAAFELIHYLNQKRVPWILENPATSKCWYLKPIQDLLLLDSCFLITADFCMFGTPWRKRASFLCNNLDRQDVARLEQRCRGSSGFCSRTQRRHQQLSGAFRGVNLTKLAQPYPTKLCKHLAYCLTCPSHY